LDITPHKTGYANITYARNCPLLFNYTKITSSSVTAVRKKGKYFYVKLVHIRAVERLIF